MRLMMTPMLLLCATACSTTTSDIRVNSRMVADVDLRALDTYQWSDAKAVAIDTTGTSSFGDAEIDALIRDAVDRELRAAGFTEVASGAALAVHLTAFATRAQAEDDPIVTQGSMLMELHHVPTDAVVWRGTVRTTADRIFTPEQTKQRIDWAIHELLAKLRR
jgi:hypothetical protein